MPIDDLESKLKIYGPFSVITVVFECGLFTDAIRITLANGAEKSP